MDGNQEVMEIEAEFSGVHAALINKNVQPNRREHTKKRLAKREEEGFCLHSSSTNSFCN